jgi:hypothetical protein
MDDNRNRAMQPTQELIDAIYREKVLRAREVPLEQKILAGAQLFDDVCERMAAGLRAENPTATEDEIEERLRQRLDFLRKLRASDVRQ